MKWLTSVLRQVVCLMLIQYAIGPINLTPHNFALKPPCGLKWRKTKHKAPLPVMKLPYARLFVLTAYENSNFCNTVFTCESSAQQEGAVAALWQQYYRKSPRLLVAHWMKQWLGPLLWQHICTKSIWQSFSLYVLNMVKVAAKRKVLCKGRPAEDFSEYLCQDSSSQSSFYGSCSFPLQSFGSSLLHYHKTSLSQIGLVIEHVSTAIILQSGRQVFDLGTAAVQTSLGRWQPGLMAISNSKRKITSWPELCRQSDIWAEKLWLRPMI